MPRGGRCGCTTPCSSADSSISTNTAIYTYMNASVIASRSFSEFVERWEDLRLLIAANERTVRARKAAEARVASIEADLERTRLELQQQEEAKQAQARSQLDSLAERASELGNPHGGATPQRRDPKWPRWRTCPQPRRPSSKA